MSKIEIMQKFATTLLIWLLLLAVPLQVQASTAVLFCSAGHHDVLEHDSFQANSGHHGNIVTTEVLLQSENVRIESLSSDQMFSVTAAQADEWAFSPAGGGDKCCVDSFMAGAPTVVQLLVEVDEPIPYALEFFVNHIPKQLSPPPREILA